MILKDGHCKAALTLSHQSVCARARALMCRFVQTDSQPEGCVMAIGFQAQAGSVLHLTPRPSCLWFFFLPFWVRGSHLVIAPPPPPAASRSIKKMVFLMIVFLRSCGKKNLLLIFQRGFPGHCKVGLNWKTRLILMTTERSQALPGSRLLAQILGTSSSIYWRSPGKEPQCCFCLTREETEACAQRPGWI